MKYTQEYYEEERESNATFIYMALIMSVLSLVVLAFVFWQNKPRYSKRSVMSDQVQVVKIQDETTAMVESVQELVSGSTLTSNQLDIWNLPDTGREQAQNATVTDDGKNGTVINQTTGETTSTLDSKTGTENAQSSTDTQNKTSVYDMTDKASVTGTDTAETVALDDGKHTEITYADGSTEWIEIKDTLAKNTYQNSRFVYQNPEMKYYVSGKQQSWFGVTLSSSQGVVDFSKLKKAGCDYVMVKIAGRGYSSGQIVMDDSYKTNMNGAKNAGIGIGAYFYSQAVTKEEVIEEAQTLLEAIKDYQVTYPIAFVMESIDGDMARTDALDMDTRTQLARLFLKEIKDAGYKPLLYGNKEWLLTKLNLEELTDYDVWLSQEESTPDYPYAFTMWQYDTELTVSGVAQDTAVSISLKDYSK